MTDIVLSSFISLFALFGKESNVDDVRAKKMLVSFLHHHYGIRNTELYVDLYSDMRTAYEMSDHLDSQQTVTAICDQLNARIKHDAKAMLLLRLMEFCGYQENLAARPANTESTLSAGGDNEAPHDIFTVIARQFNISDVYFQYFVDYLSNKPSDVIQLFHPEGFEGQLKTLLDPTSKTLIFTYTGTDTVLLNDVPILSGVYQVWQQSSVLKSSYSGKQLYYSTIIDAYNKANGVEEDKHHEVEFCGRDINFRFPNSDNGMHNLSFTLRSGELLAIMGGSGTGKTTLLSLLNGTLQPQQGTITINGHDISEPSAKNLIGFVPQDDLLIEELTVYQNLWYTAKLCFEGMPDDEIDNRVMKTLKDLGLDAAKNLKVGSAINKYISGGQRKRLNIALELIREPAVLFLDEPTSGLSSADTEKVINLLKEQTFKGKLIVVNIHQPSSDVYKLFDRLWLLDRGGYPVFDGNPINAITYFKEEAHYADASTSACPTCGNVNPEIVLNIIDEKRLNNSGEPTDDRKVSPQEWHELYLERRPQLAVPEVSSVPQSDQKKPGVLKQFSIFLRRNVKSKITNLQYLLITLLEAPLLAVGCALLTRYAPPEGYSVMANKNLVSYLFMAVIVATFIGMSGSAEEIIKDRALLKRERFLNLSYASYIWSKIVLMGFVSFVQTFLFIVVGNSIMGLHGMLFTWWPILFVTALLANLTGLLLSKWLSSIIAIYITIPILLIPQILLCGLVVSFSDLTPKSTTGNVPFIGDVIPSRWAYEALAVTTYTDNAYEAPLFEADKQKYEDFYYNQGFLYELSSQLATLKHEQKHGKDENPDHLNIIRINLPELSAYCGMQPYAGDYSVASLNAYLDEAKNVMAQCCNRSTLRADKLMSSLVRTMGKEQLLQLKRNNHNAKLEDMLIGADQQRMLDVIDGHIVARAGAVYLTPHSQLGRAPFYSSEKILGSWHVKTFWFNLAVMMLMAVVLTILLLNNKYSLLTIKTTKKQ